MKEIRRVMAMPIEDKLVGRINDVIDMLKGLVDEHSDYNPDMIRLSMEALVEGPPTLCLVIEKLETDAEYAERVNKEEKETLKKIKEIEKESKELKRIEKEFRKCLEKFKKI